MGSAEPFAAATAMVGATSSRSVCKGREAFEDLLVKPVGYEK